MLLKEVKVWVKVREDSCVASGDVYVVRFESSITLVLQNLFTHIIFFFFSYLFLIR